MNGLKTNESPNENLDLPVDFQILIWEWKKRHTSTYE